MCFIMSNKTKRYSPPKKFIPQHPGAFTSRIDPNKLKIKKIAKILIVLAIFVNKKVQ